MRVGGKRRRNGGDSFTTAFSCFGDWTVQLGKQGEKADCPMQLWDRDTLGCDMTEECIW